MNRKKILEKRMARLVKRREELTARALASKDAEEVRSINRQLEDINEEISETGEELETFEEEEKGQQTGEGAEGRAENLHANGMETRGGTPIASYGNIGGTQQKSEETTAFSSMEYRKAFKDYVQRGTPIPADLTERAAGDTGVTVAADIGAVVPQTVMNELIKDVSKVYGNIYSKVRKLNIRGGVKFPISKLGATLKWIGETEVSDKQKAGDIKEFIIFSYNIAEIRVAQTLLSQVVSLDIFESEITRIIVEAYVKGMDKMIISGTGTGQPLGITNDPRVTQTVEFTAEQFSDWTYWRKNLFVKIPLSKRGSGEFLFPASTVESYLMTMKDKNDRPLFREATDLSVGNTAGKFFGRTTDLVEPDIITDFDTAAAGDVIGIFWVPYDYAINTNLQFGMKRYYDDDANEWINKGLTILDGKILDTSGCYLLKKKGTA